MTNEVCRENEAVPQPWNSPLSACGVMNPQKTGLPSHSECQIVFRAENDKPEMPGEGYGRSPSTLVKGMVDRAKLSHTTFPATFGPNERYGGRFDRPAAVTLENEGSCHGTIDPRDAWLAATTIDRTIHLLQLVPHPRKASRYELAASQPHIKQARTCVTVDSLQPANCGRGTHAFACAIEK